MKKENKNFRKKTILVALLTTSSVLTTMATAGYLKKAASSNNSKISIEQSEGEENLNNISYEKENVVNQKMNINPTTKSAIILQDENGEIHETTELAVLKAELPIESERAWIVYLESEKEDEKIYKGITLKDTIVAKISKEGNELSYYYISAYDQQMEILSGEINTVFGVSSLTYEEAVDIERDLNEELSHSIKK